MTSPKHKGLVAAVALRHGARTNGFGARLLERAATEILCESVDGWTRAAIYRALIRRGGLSASRVRALVGLSTMLRPDAWKESGDGFVCYEVNVSTSPDEKLEFYKYLAWELDSFVGFTVGLVQVNSFGVETEHDPWMDYMVEYSAGPPGVPVKLSPT